MQSRLIRVGIVVGALILPSPVSAQRTGTVLLGLMPLDGPRSSFGVAFGYSPSVGGFEIEYLGTFGRERAGHSSAGGIFANFIVHPVTMGNLQFFAVGGFGMWGELFADGRGTGELGAKDFGGGINIMIAEPLRLRLDYRMFLLDALEDGSRAPSTTRPQRLSVGVHLIF